MGAVTPARHSLDGFTQLLRAECTKFSTVRGWVIALGLTVVTFVLVASLSAWASRSPQSVAPTGPGGEPVSDTYMLVHQPLAGDGTVTARVTSLSGAYIPISNISGGAIGTSSTGGPGSQLHPGLAPWAKAGIIIEPDIRQGTDYAAVMVTGSHGVRMQYDYTRDSPGIAGSVTPSSPRWLRLTRSGDLVTGYDSVDGHHWAKIGATVLAGLPDTVQVGLFVASPIYFPAGVTAGSASEATAAFDHTLAQGDLPQRSWTAATITGSSAYPAASTPGWHHTAAGSFTMTGSGDIAPLVGGILSPAWSGASIVNGTIIALLIVIVVSTMFATSEHRRGLIRTTFAASPRRARLPAAKALVAGSLAFTAGAIATTIAESTTRHLLAANGNYLFPQSGTTFVRVIVGTGLLLGLAAVLATALGIMLRRSTMAVAAGIMLLVVPGVLGSQSGNWLMRFTPTAAFAIQATLPRTNLVSSTYTPPNGYFPISPSASLAVLTAYAAVALGAATWTVRRRDP